MTATPSLRPAPSGRGVGARIVGVLGEGLVTVGALLLLFVVWQVWWTDVEAGAVQAERAEAFRAEAVVPPAKVAPPRTGPPPVLEVPPAGTTFALLRVPRWGDGYAMPISEGVDRASVLDSLGIGHYPGTAMPGAAGNAALAGHRQSHGRPFWAVTTLQRGDPLVVETADVWYVYRVTESRIVTPRDVEVVAPVPGRPGESPTQAMVTLTTCHPLFSTSQRYVVHGVLDHWAARSDGTPSVLLPATVAG